MAIHVDNKPTGKAVPAATRLLVIISLLSLLLPASSVLARGSLQLTSGFDNNHIHSTDPGQRYLEVLVTTPEQVGMPDQRLPLNLAVVIDISGSMGGRKMHHVQEAVLDLLDRLQPGDRFSLITYANDATVLIASQPLEDLYRARSFVRSMRAGGGTNLHAGLTEGYHQVARHARTDTINRVLLFSDGLANMGIQSPYRLGEVARQEAVDGISLSTFGVGLDFNENLMASLSENGRGMYYFINNPGEIGGILAREFRNTEQLVATDIRIEVQFHKDIQICEVMANRYEIHGNQVTMYGGDLAAGELRRFQIKIRPPQHKTGHFRAGGVKMTYRPAGRDHLQTYNNHLKLRYLANAGLIKRQRNQAISERSDVFEAHYARSRAAKAVDQGDIQNAQNILTAVKKAIRTKGRASTRLKKELAEIDAYAAALRKPLGQEERARIQKSVKYDSYILEGC